MKAYLSILFLSLDLLLFTDNIFANNTDSLKTSDESKFEPLPIVYSDSNDGFGYGAKAFF